MTFAVPVQTKAGDEKKQWYETRRHIDHAGLELMLHDEVPGRSRRNTVRELVAWVVAMVRGDKPEVELPEGLETQEEIDQAWERLGVRAWL